MIYLIQTQAQNQIPKLEKIPYCLTSKIGFDRVENWLYRTWWWAERNALESHARRPWGSFSRGQMLNRLYSDQIPF